MSYTLAPATRWPDCWILYVDGFPQSYVNLADPGHLAFAYMRRLAGVIDAVAPAGQQLRVLHLGGGGMTLPRYVAATRPRSTQVVIDHDPGLMSFVLRRLPLPPSADIRVAVADARAAAEAMGDADFDVVVADVYVGPTVAHRLASVEFAGQAARVLRPGGVFAMNLIDVPPLKFSRVEAATLMVAFGEVCAIGEAGMMRRDVHGNVVLVAAHRPGTLPMPRIARHARADWRPARLLRGHDLRAFVAGADPLYDAPTGCAADI